MKPAVSVKRVILVLKVLVLVVIGAFVVAGHPPSVAQSSNQLGRGQEVSAEDVRQDTEIDYIKTQQVTQAALFGTTQAIIAKQGEDLARLDTKMTMLVAFLGLLQVGGLFLTVFPMKRMKGGGE